MINPWIVALIVVGFPIICILGGAALYAATSPRIEKEEEY